MPLLAVAGVAAYLAFGSAGDTEEEASSNPSELPVPWVDSQGVSPIVGSLDVNRADRSLWLSTNTGLWRVAPNADRPEQVTGRLTTDLGTGDISEQLVVRFRGPDRMIASGHPPANSHLPPALGLIESRDGGKTWQNRVPPAPLVDLELDPEDPSRWIASTNAGMVVSSDEGRSRQQADPIPNMRFTWPAGDTLYRIEPGGIVSVSGDGGDTWEKHGSTGGEPQAIFSDGPDHLHVALIDGTIKEAKDGGVSWTDRVSPPA